MAGKLSIEKETRRVEDLDLVEGKEESMTVTVLINEYFHSLFGLGLFHPLSQIFSLFHPLNPLSPEGWI